jgi:RNA polymerase sigma-70 factor (ECF subfamily)
MTHTVEQTSSTLLLRLRDTTDEASWGEFVGLYEPLLLRYARKMGAADDRARDIVQNIFVALLRKLPTFELDRSKGRFRTWLWRVTRNAVIDAAREAQQQDQIRRDMRKGFEEGVEDPDPDWDVTFHQRVLEYAKQKVKERTNPNTWACFEEHLVKGRSGAAVGAEMGLPANTVYVYAARVFARVREQCEAYLEDPGHE